MHRAIKQARIVIAFILTALACGAVLTSCAQNDSSQDHVVYGSTS